MICKCGQLMTSESTRVRVQRIPARPDSLAVVARCSRRGCGHEVVSYLRFDDDPVFGFRRLYQHAA